jgi:hypothetical protein
MWERAARPPVFDAPLDAWHAWLGMGLVSLAVAGTVLSFPAATPGDAGAVADAVDEVAASEHDARGEVAVPAEEIRLGPLAVGLRADGRTAHARFEYGPVTPVRGGELRPVLAGRPPEAVFADPGALRAAVERAQRRDRAWRDAPRTLRVRRVSWGEVDATLVG